LIPLRDSLKKRADILPETEIPKIFSNVEQLFTVNSELLTQMDIQLEKGIDPTKVESILSSISKIFVNMCDNLKVYAEYCCNNPTAIETLSHCSKNPAYVAYEDLTRKSTGRVRLDGFIAKPVQRICKYPLFFKDFLKVTKTDENCYEILKKAYDSLEAVAIYINDYKRDKENKAKLKEIQRKVRGFKKIDIQGRFFHRESSLLKLKPNGKSQERKVYLFSDILLYVKEKSSNNLAFRGDIPLQLAVFRDHPTIPNTFQMKKNR